MEVGLVIGGASLLMWCALLLLQAHLVQGMARASLAAGVDTDVGAESAAPATAINTPLADLSIPRLNLSAMVLRGTDARTLRVGLGHIANTALPGEGGNVAIAGHRDTFFRPLRNVRVGDDVFLTTGRARLHYQVSSLSVVGPRQISVLRPTAKPSLTLVTCYPFWVLGQAPDRFVVRATRVDDVSERPTLLR